MSFSDLESFPQTVTLLQRSLERGRLAHAYLFSGGDLQELEIVARTLAKVINCQAPPARADNGQPLDCCDRCQTCRQVEAGSHVDVHWLRPESKLRVIRVQQMRDLLHAMHLKSTDAGYKVGIISGADRLNPEAANTFLKTLEEPPERCVLILLSTDPRRVLETVRSRCLRLDLGDESPARSRAKQVPWLKSFVGQAAGDQRSLMDRYRLLGSLLDRLAGIKKEVERTVGEQSPLDRYADYKEIEPDLIKRWETELVAGIEAEYRLRRSEVLEAVQWWLRDIWITGRRIPDDLLAFPELRAETRTVAERVGDADALKNLSAMEGTQRLLMSNVQEALALEVGLLKLRL